MNNTLHPLKPETHPGRCASRKQSAGAESSTAPKRLWQVCVLATAFNLTTMDTSAMEVLA
jgi:hypothetical protein